MYSFLLCSLNNGECHKIKFKSLRAAKSFFGRCDPHKKDRLSIFVLNENGETRILATRAKDDNKWLNYELYRDEFKEKFK